MRCPENCIDQHCFPANGSCVLGCNWNYCKNDRCDKITNMCIDGCNEGITGDFCIGESYIAIKIFIDWRGGRTSVFQTFWIFEGIVYLLMELRNIVFLYMKNNPCLKMFYLSRSGSMVRTLVFRFFCPFSFGNCVVCPSLIYGF
jgi:hypothetical protein